MTTLVWTDTLSAPRSLATRSETAVALIEDPGVLELSLGKADADLVRCEEVLGVALPQTPWHCADNGEIRSIWTGPGRWRILVPRPRAVDFVAALADGLGPSRVYDLTGGYSLFRIVGATAAEILMRVCPLDLRPVEPGQARGTSVARIRCLLVRESSPENSWLVLAPRSFAEHLAGALTEAARTPGRLGLFEPAEPPPV